MFLDIHTHSRSTFKDVQSIHNIIIPASLTEESVSLAEEIPDCASAGIHPWYINEKHYQVQFRMLESIARRDEVKLIGECGLDRLRGPAMNLQMFVFERHVALAEEVRKPVLIHCVRCFNELLHLKNGLRPSVPLVVHGFNNKPEVARQLVRAGFYLSFGGAVLDDSSNAARVLPEIPSDRVFLETDDRDFSIEQIYHHAAGLKNVSTNTLKELIFANYLSLGGK